MMNASQAVLASSDLEEKGGNDNNGRRHGGNSGSVRFGCVYADRRDNGCGDNGQERKKKGKCDNEV